MTTCHCVRPLSETPTGFTDATPGVAAIAAVTASAEPLGAITRVGSVTPPGKCAARVLKPSTESALTLNWSISDSPIGVPIRPVVSTPSDSTEAIATRPACADTQSATRCHAPAPAISCVPGCGMKGQNNFRPNSASSGGRTPRTNTAATTRPAAACTPRLRVVGELASSSDNSASTTVALLAAIAGPA